MSIHTDNEFISVTEAAKLAGVTVGAVRHRIYAGHMPALKANERCLLVRRGDVQKWIEERKEACR